MTQITEDYVSFETAKLLKEKGFDEDIDLWRDENGEMFFRHKYDISSDWRVKAQQKVYLCPTLQMAMKWLRKMYNILLVVDYEWECDTTPYYFKVYRLGENGKPERVAVSCTYKTIRRYCAKRNK